MNNECKDSDVSEGESNGMRLLMIFDYYINSMTKKTIHW